jgi:hypothetical protein
MTDTENPEAIKESKAVTPCCTGCRGTGYSYRQQKIANVDGLLVYCSSCGGIFSWSPNVIAAPTRS